VRPQLEGVEQRLMLSVSASIVGGQLQVRTTPDTFDQVALSEINSQTFVNDQGFADAKITRGIQVQLGFDNRDSLIIHRTVKPVTVDGGGGLQDITLGDGGFMEFIQAPVTLTNFAPIDEFGGGATVSMNDQFSTFAGRNVTLNSINGFYTIDGLAPARISLDAAGLSEVDINGNDQGNTFNVVDLPPADGPVKLSLVPTHSMSAISSTRSTTC
jgi:hypothetical protein